MSVCSSLSYCNMCISNEQRTFHPHVWWISMRNVWWSNSIATRIAKSIKRQLTINQWVKFTTTDACMIIYTIYTCTITFEIIVITRLIGSIWHTWCVLCYTVPTSCYKLWPMIACGPLPFLGGTVGHTCTFIQMVHPNWTSYNRHVTD